MLCIMLPLRLIRMPTSNVVPDDELPVGENVLLHALLLEGDYVVLGGHLVVQNNEESKAAYIQPHSDLNLLLPNLKAFFSCASTDNGQVSLHTALLGVQATGGPAGSWPSERGGRFFYPPCLLNLTLAW